MLCAVPLQGAKDGFDYPFGLQALWFFISRGGTYGLLNVWSKGRRVLRRRGLARLAPVLKSFVGDRNNDQGSHACRWRKSVTPPPLDQPCDPRNFRSIGFVFRH
jgi:hypothetical protein